MPELSLLNRMRKNLCSRIKNLIFGCHIQTLTELKAECKRAEKYIEELENEFSKRNSIDEID